MEIDDKTDPDRRRQEYMPGAPIRDTKYSAAVGGICMLLAVVIVVFSVLQAAFGTVAVLLYMFGPAVILGALVARHLVNQRKKNAG